MISLNAVTYGYGKQPLFEGLSLDFRTGGCYGLLGLNGAGKTSLLKLVAGALLPRGGSIRAFGRDPSLRQAEHLADLCFVPEDPAPQAVRPEQWLSRYGVFRPAFDRPAFQALCDQFELPTSGKLSTWSYGQRKKFALAAAMASGARTILFDEPTNGLDIPGKAQFRRALAGMQTDERVLVVSTHQVRDLENLIDPITVIHRGRMVFEASSQDLLANLSTRHLDSLEDEAVVAARREAVGYSALLATPGDSLDLELVFAAAIHKEGRLKAALAGRLAPSSPIEEVLL